MRKTSKSLFILLLSAVLVLTACGDRGEEPLSATFTPRVMTAVPDVLNPQMTAIAEGFDSLDNRFEELESRLDQMESEQLTRADLLKTQAYQTVVATPQPAGIWQASSTPQPAVGQQGIPATGGDILQTTPTRVISSMQQWPLNVFEAALVFTDKADHQGRLSQNSFGGWHFAEGEAVNLTVPAGVIFEGYNDFGTANRSIPQGGQAVCWTVLGPATVFAQGGTFWKPDEGLTQEQMASKILAEQVPFREMEDCVPMGFTPVPYPTTP